jgi:hypothetical protein
MSARKSRARWWLIALVGGGLWALGCAAVVGADDYKVAGGSGTGTGGGCTPNGSSCDGAAGSCCSGNCFDFTLDMPLGKYCVGTCASNDDCMTGCCVTQGPKMGCAPRGFCAGTCGDPLTPCSGAGDCCLGSLCICLTSPCNADTPSECRQICRTNADCDSGCCGQPSGTTLKVCTMASNCTTPPP